jgi:hypothetical protein
MTMEGEICMSIGLCDRRTEQEWVARRPRNGTVVGEACGDGDKCQALRRRSRRWAGGQREATHRVTKMGACRYVKAK